jgi:hypothetical protein
MFSNGCDTSIDVISMNKCEANPKEDKTLTAPIYDPRKENLKGRVVIWNHIYERKDR